MQRQEAGIIALQDFSLHEKQFQLPIKVSEKYI